MEFAGPIIGMPFSLEGFAFFTEAIFLGVYLYGWDRISPRAHLLAGVHGGRQRRGIGHLRGDRQCVDERSHRLRLSSSGKAINVDPIAGMLNPMMFQQTLHMTLAAYAATGFAVAGIHAFLLLIDRENAFHRRALAIAMLVGAPAAVLQPLSGHHSGQVVAEYQPAKLAAMEAHFHTGPTRPLPRRLARHGQGDHARYAIPIPGGLSMLAFGDPDAVVEGLDPLFVSPRRLPGRERSGALARAS